MNNHPDDRPRISFDIPRELLNEFNDMLVGWRIKNALFDRLVLDMVTAMRGMSPKMRRLYIISIIDDGVENYIKGIKEAERAVKRQEEVDTESKSS